MNQRSSRTREPGPIAARRSSCGNEKVSGLRSRRTRGSSIVQPSLAASSSMVGALRRVPELVMRRPCVGEAAGGRAYTEGTEGGEAAEGNQESGDGAADRC